MAMAASVDHCADLVRRSDFRRYATALFAPLEHRPALLALYAFNAEIARVRLNVTQPMAGEIRLQWWDEVLSGERAAEAAGHPVASELLKAIETYGLGSSALRELIAVHRFDLYTEPMQTRAELEGYLDQTAGELFTLAARALGERTLLLKPLAHHAALGYGMVETIERLPLQAARKQLYMPAELMAECGTSIEDVFAGKASSPLRLVVQAMAEQAKTHLSQAMLLLPDTKVAARSPFLLLALASWRLRQLARLEHDPFSLSTPAHFRELWTVWRASRSFETL